MKRFLLLTFGVIAGLCAGLRLDAAGQYQRTNERGKWDQVCVYTEANYQGTELCYASGEEIHSLGTRSKSISSIRVFGRVSVTIYENPAFRGHSTQLTSDLADLSRLMMAGNTSWRGHIESLRISGASTTITGNDRRTAGDFRGDQQQQPRNGICVYDRPNYEGRSECWSEGRNIPDLARTTWGGQISSIRLFGRSVATVYQSIAYAGESLTVSKDIPDLAAISGPVQSNKNDSGTAPSRGRGNASGVASWDHQIASLQVQAQRQKQ